MTATAFPRRQARLATAGLLCCLVFPLTARAGGDAGPGAYDIGEQLFERQHYRAAQKYLEKALKRDDTRALYPLGRIAEAAGREQEALERYRRFVDLGLPEDTRSRDAEQRARAIAGRQKKQADRTGELLARGKRLFAKRNCREAKQALLQAASRDTTNPEVHFFLGEVYQCLEEYDKATAEYRKAKRSY
jgi:tetratricopeptide (TPR) repeat protein